MRLLHSADWQIGARFRRFGERAPWLRKVRIQTLCRTLEQAAAKEVDAFIIAGDLFEDHGIEPSVLREVWEAFAGVPSLPVFIIPGNHDPANGPGAIWCRQPFAEPPPNVRVFTSAQAVQLAGDAWLIASPLKQKRSTIDPSLELAEIAATLPDSAIKIGVTHGCPAVDGFYEADDFPIARDAASRADLDYLGIGHWHGYQVFDDGRLVMPGTPEQTDFAETNAGFVMEVEIERRRSQPRLTRLRAGLLNWQRWDCDLTDPEYARAAIDQFARGIASPANSVLRVSLQGAASPQVVEELSALLRSRLENCGILELLDETTAGMDSAEIENLKQDHPLLSSVLNDLDQLAAGVSSSSLSSLSKDLNCSPEQITPETIARARQLLFTELRKLRKSC